MVKESNGRAKAFLLALTSPSNLFYHARTMTRGKIYIQLRKQLMMLTSRVRTPGPGGKLSQSSLTISDFNIEPVYPLFDG